VSYKSQRSRDERIAAGELVTDVEMRQTLPWEVTYGDLALDVQQALDAARGLIDEAFLAYEAGRYHDAASRLGAASLAAAKVLTQCDRLDYILRQQPALDPTIRGRHGRLE
jgi:hypothetical protein